MCRRVSCAKCGKPTFEGCGAHVEQVLAGVPKDERCSCRSSGRASTASSESAPAPRPKPRFWPF